MAMVLHMAYLVTPTFYIGNEAKGYTQIVGAQPLASFENIINQLTSSSSSNSTSQQIS